MAEIRVPAVLLETLEVPPICAISGRPTKKRRKITIEGNYRPANGWWSLFVLLGGFLFLSVKSQRVQWKVPMSGKVSTLRRLSKIALVLFMVALLLGAMTTYLIHDTASVATLVVGLAGFVGSVWLLRRNSLRCKWLDESNVLVGNVHPEFADAVGQAIHNDPGLISV